MSHTAEIISQLKYAIHNGTDVIPIDFQIRPTKGNATLCRGSLKRDRELENLTKSWLNERSSFETIAEKYKRYDPSGIISEWPQHYPTRFVSMSGVLAEGRNIFIVFPLALGRIGKTESDYFGFEFIDVWEKVFHSIVFPCVAATFCQQSIDEISCMLRPVISKTIYLASVFHEIGHRIGPWKVVPKHNPKLKLSRFHLNILCELATDSFLVSFLSDFPEIKYFVILQRLFWFGRFGFSEERQNNDSNEDNDTWIASYLWTKLIRHSCIVETDGQLMLKLHNADAAFSEIIDELAHLGQKVYAEPLHQDKIVQEWMCTSAPNIAGQFTLSADLKAIFSQCLNISTAVTLQKHS